jgi:hypothetical protein
MTVSRFSVCALLSAASLVGATNAAAQTRLPPQANRPPADEGIGVGPLGAWTNSMLQGSHEDTEQLKARNDWMAGGWVGGNPLARVSFLVEAAYVTKGYREREFDGSLQINYIEIPVLLRMNIGSRTREGADFYGVAGPALAFRVKATLQGPEGDVDVGPDFHTFDVGVLVGGGVEVRRIGAEVRVNWGMRALFEPSEDSEPFKNLQIQLVGKYRF